MHHLRGAAFATSESRCRSEPALATPLPRPVLTRPSLQLEGSTRELGSALSQLTHLALRCRIESVAVAPEFLEGLCQVWVLLLLCSSVERF